MATMNVSFVANGLVKIQALYVLNVCNNMLETIKGLSITFAVHFIDW